MNNVKLIVTALTILTVNPAFAGGFSEHTGQASGASSQAVGHSVAGTAKLASGAVAVPLMSAGAIGQASGQAGKALWSDANKPLPIGDEAVTAGPPPKISR